MLNDLLGRGAPMPWLSKRPAARLMLARSRFQGACLGEVTLKDPLADGKTIMTEGPEDGAGQGGRRPPHGPAAPAPPPSRVAAGAGLPMRTARRWPARDRADGPAGPARPIRPEAGTRIFPKEMVELIEGLALLDPRPSVASIHRAVVQVAEEKGGEPHIRPDCTSSAIPIVHRASPDRQ